MSPTCWPPQPWLPLLLVLLLVHLLLLLHGVLSC
jgi:hypothetical protein